MPPGSEKKKGREKDTTKLPPQEPSARLFSQAPGGLLSTLVPETTENISPLRQQIQFKCPVFFLWRAVKMCAKWHDRSKESWAQENKDMQKRMSQKPGEGAMSAEAIL